LTFTYSTASHPFLFPHSAHHQPLHSFPTRRSSDLIGPTYTVKPFLQYYFDPSKYDPAQAVTIDTRQTYVPGNIFQGAICTINTPATPAGDPDTSPNPCAGLTNFGNPYNGMVQ